MSIGGQPCDNTGLVIVPSISKPTVVAMTNSANPVNPVNPEYILTISCLDQRGIVHRVSGFLAEHGCRC